jgi:hypothetical protein
MGAFDMEPRGHPPALTGGLFDSSGPVSGVALFVVIW